MASSPIPHDGPGGPADQTLRVWLEDYGPALRRYFEKRVNPAEAEDMVQDVFLSLQVRDGGDQPRQGLSVPGGPERPRPSSLQLSVSRSDHDPERRGDRRTFARTHIDGEAGVGQTAGRARESAAAIT